MRYAATTSQILLACQGALLTGGSPACAAEPFWAFQPPDDSPLPAVRDCDWAANPLDPKQKQRLQTKIAGVNKSIQHETKRLLGALDDIADLLGNELSDMDQQQPADIEDEVEATVDRLW